MKLRVHDPDGLATRRAIRAAIAVPIGLAITLYGFGDQVGAAFTLFGLTGLLVNSDFAGSARRRTLAYLLTGVGGSVALLVGWAASLTVASAVIVTMVIAFAMTFLGVFRGAVSTGAATVLLVYVLAVCIDGQWAQMGGYLLGWWVAVILATVTALVILPRRRRASNRPSMAAAFEAAANAARAAWIGDRDEEALAHHVREFDDAIDAMDAHVAGQQYRTSGVTQRDATLNLMANQLDGIRLLVDQAAAHPPPATDDFRQRAELAQAIVDALHSLSVAMMDKSHVVSARSLDHAREEMADGITAWVLASSRQGMSSADISEQVAAQHQLRIFALIVEQLMEMGRVANGAEVEDLDVMPPVPKRSLRRLIGAQLTWRAPWLRNAIRTSVGLGLGVTVMVVTGVDHSFWVLLGVISVLRFDAVGTRRFALLAIVGTLVGVLIGLGLFAILGTGPTTLWVLLPLLTFLAAWASGAVNFPSGQAAFSAMVLVALGIINWPPRQADALVRVEDIAMGAGVALVVGLLLWPRGAAGYLRRQLAGALRDSGAYLTGAINAFVEPATRSDLPALRATAAMQMYRAGETFDIASVQRGPTEDVRAWVPTLSLANLTGAVARIIAEFTHRYTISERPLLESLARARDASQEEWGALADLVDPTVPDPVAPLESAPVAYSSGVTITDEDQARALVISIWIVDWVRHLSALGPGVVPARSENEAKQPTTRMPA